MSGPWIWCMDKYSEFVPFPECNYQFSIIKFGNFCTFFLRLFAFVSRDPRRESQSFAGKRVFVRALKRAPRRSKYKTLEWRKKKWCINTITNCQGRRHAHEYREIRRNTTGHCMREKHMDNSQKFIRIRSLRCRATSLVPRYVRERGTYHGPGGICRKRHATFLPMFIYNV